MDVVATRPVKRSASEREISKYPWQFRSDLVETSVTKLMRLPTTVRHEMRLTALVFKTQETTSEQVEKSSWLFQDDELLPAIFVLSFWQLRFLLQKEIGTECEEIGTECDEISFSKLSDKVVGSVRKSMHGQPSLGRENTGKKKWNSFA